MRGVGEFLLGIAALTPTYVGIRFIDNAVSKQRGQQLHNADYARRRR
jgi:hypothetical protein